MSDNDNSWFDNYNQDAHAENKYTHDDHEIPEIDNPTPSGRYEEYDEYESDVDQLPADEPVEKSRANRLVKVGCLALVLSVGGSVAYAGLETYDPKKSKKDNTLQALEVGLSNVIGAPFDLIDKITGNEPTKSPTYNAYKPDGSSDESPSPTSTTSKSPKVTPTPKISPSPTPSPTKNRTPEACIADMPIRYKVGQQLGVAVTTEGSYFTDKNVSIPETFEELRQYDIGNIVVIGKLSKETKESIKKFSDGKVLNDPALVINDPTGANMNLKQENAQAVFEKPLTGEQLVNHYKNLKENGIRMTFLRINDTFTNKQKTTVAPSSQPSTSPSPNQTAKNIDEHLAAAKAAGIELVVVHNPGFESMSTAGETTKNKFDHALLVSTKRVNGPVPATANNQTKNTSTAEAFQKDVYQLARKQYGVNGVIMSDDLGKVLDENSKPIPLKDSAIDVLKNGGSPFFLTDANNTEKPLSLDVRLKSLIDSGEQAVKSNELSEKTLNDMMMNRLTMQDRVEQACRISDREAQELKISH